MYRLSWSKNIRLLFFLLPVFIAQCTWGQEYPSEKNPLNDYYDFVRTTISLPLDQQIDSLKVYIKTYPHFEKAYLRLLEHYMVKGQLAEAKEYFRKLAEQPAHHQNSSWMLAKIADSEEKPDTIFAFLQNMIRAGNLSIEQLSYIIDFDFHFPGRFKTRELLSQYSIDPHQQEIINILFDYYEARYELVIKKINLLPESAIHDPLLMHFWGRCYYQLNRYSQADSIWRVGLRVSQELGDIQAESRAFTTLGVIEAMRANYEKAISCYDSAYVIANSIKDWYRMQLLAGNLGNIYKLREKFSIAIEKYREAIQICESIGGFRHLTTWYSALAQTYYYTENFNEALKIYQKSEELAVKENNFERQVFIKMDRGNIYWVLNFTELVENEFQKAYELVSIHNLEHLRDQVSTRIAELLIAKKEYVKAREIYRNRILSMPENADLKWKAYYIGLIGNTYLLEGRFADARQEYLTALEFARRVDSPHDIASFQCDLTDLKVNMDELESAVEDYQNILNYALSAENNDLQIRALTGLGNTYRKSRNIEQAILYYKQCVNIIERKWQSISASQMRIGYFSRKVTVYQKLEECYLRKYEISADPLYLDSLFYYSEMSRARSLANAWSRIKSNAGSKNTPQYQEYRQLCEELRSLQRELRLNALKGISGEEDEALHAQLDIVRYSLVAQQLRLKESIREPENQNNLSSVVPLKDLTERLQNKDTGLLVYYTHMQKPFVLALSGEQKKIVYIPAAKIQIDSAIHELILPFHRLNKTTLETTPFRAALAYQLYLWLIKPVEEVLSLPERLIIVPDLSIVNLPFEMLLTREPEKPEFTPTDIPNYSPGFLQLRYAIVYSPNTRILKENSSRSLFAGKNLFTLANPFNFNVFFEDYDEELRSGNDWFFPPLPNSEIEAENIKQLYPSAKIFQQEKATKSVFLEEAPKYQILHIATHGIVDTTFEAFSGLVLAMEDDSSDDGCLMGYELSEVSLNCDLITLSACETGRGKLVNGEGVLGLPRLFLGAGAKSVLMTLWKVDDRFTSLLMSEFYNQFLKNNVPKADALARAKRRMLKTVNENSKIHYQHPLFWASFALYGDPGVERSGILKTISSFFIFAAILILIFIAVYYYRFRKPKETRQ